MIWLMTILLWLGPVICRGVEPNSSPSTANGIWEYFIVADSLAPTDAEDWFRLDDVVEGFAYEVTVLPVVPRMDPVLEIYNRDGKQLAWCDDYDFYACQAGDSRSCGCTARFRTTALPVYAYVYDILWNSDYACHDYLLEYKPAPLLTNKTYVPLIIERNSCPGCIPTSQ